jgi:SOS-response transcriptional repressor LexA
MRQPLTKRQHEVFEYIRSFINAHGYAPSYTEIAGGLGLNAIATVWKHVDALREKGHIAHDWGRSRSIRLCVGACPTCGRATENTANESEITKESSGFAVGAEV